MQGRDLCPDISIHALREEGDDGVTATNDVKADFYPRPPRGGRPYGDETKIQALMISIHALREEGDVVALPQSPQG